MDASTAIALLMGQLTAINKRIDELEKSVVELKSNGASTSESPKAKAAPGTKSPPLKSVLGAMHADMSFEQILKTITDSKPCMLNAEQIEVCNRKIQTYNGYLQLTTSERESSSKTEKDTILTYIAGIGNTQAGAIRKANPAESQIPRDIWMAKVDPKYHKQTKEAAGKQKEKTSVPPPAPEVVDTHVEKKVLEAIQGIASVNLTQSSGSNSAGVW